MSNETNENSSTTTVDDLTQHNLSNLKILAKIKTDNKLYFRDGIFYIDSAKSTQGISRWWSKESRKKTINDLDNFVTKLFRNIDQIYKNECSSDSSKVNDISTNYYSPISNTPTVFEQENSNLLIQFSTEMSGAIAGLANLKVTYKKDITTLSNLEIIIEKLSIRMKKIQALLKVGNKKIS